MHNPTTRYARSPPHQKIISVYDILAKKAMADLAAQNILDATQVLHKRRLRQTIRTTQADSTSDPLSFDLEP